MKLLDNKTFENNKIALKNEILQLQQNMKAIVASADDRYTDMSFDTPQNLVINPGNTVLCKIKLRGCFSPLTFHCDIIDIKNADLKIYLDTNHREPDENNHMRKVDRLKLFYFY